MECLAGRADDVIGAIANQEVLQCKCVPGSFGDVLSPDHAFEVRCRKEKRLQQTLVQGSR